MLRSISFVIVFLLFAGCGVKNGLIQSEYGNIVRKSSTFDRCTNFGYIAISEDETFGKLFTEYISLDSSCRWNGLARGYFVTLFMDEIKAKSYKQVEKREFKNIEVLTYLVDDYFYVNIINNYTVYEDKLIIDYSGIYSTNLIQSFDATYINNYLNSPRLDVNYFKSLVRYNFFNHYFVVESSSFW